MNITFQIKLRTVPFEPDSNCFCLSPRSFPLDMVSLVSCFKPLFMASEKQLLYPPNKDISVVWVRTSLILLLVVPLKEDAVLKAQTTPSDALRGF